MNSEFHLSDGQNSFQGSLEMLSVHSLIQQYLWDNISASNVPAGSPSGGEDVKVYAFDMN